MCTSIKVLRKFLSLTHSGCGESTDREREWERAQEGQYCSHYLTSICGEPVIYQGAKKIVNNLQSSRGQSFIIISLLLLLQTKWKRSWVLAFENLGKSAFFSKN